MIKLSILFGTICLFITCDKQVHSHSRQYVEFEHTGKTSWIVPTIIISLKKIPIKLSDHETTDLKQMLADSSKMDTQKTAAFIEMRYNQIITDSITLTEIKKFVFSHQNLLENFKHINNDPFDDSSFNIIINGSTELGIYCKLKRQFFLELVTDLKQQRCDPKVVDEISSLIQSSALQAMKVTSSDAGVRVSRVRPSDK